MVEWAATEMRRDPKNPSMYLQQVAASIRDAEYETNSTSIDQAPDERIERVVRRILGAQSSTDYTSDALPTGSSPPWRSKRFGGPDEHQGAPSCE
jgi:hypothetical protein